MRRAAALAASLFLLQPLLDARQQVAERPEGGVIFKSGIDLVSMSAVVRDRKGRVVRDLSRQDFELLDKGQLRPIIDFRSDEAPIALALLVDSSGSMQIGSRLTMARTVASALLSTLEPGRDQAALYTFDSRLRQLRGFTRERIDPHASMAGVDGFGLTSLYDAIAATARDLAAHGGSHRAVVVLTDGVDTSSRLSAPEVSGIASSIDVPIYIVAVVSEVDRAGAAGTVERDEPMSGELVDLAAWTGGQFHVTSAPSDTGVAVGRIVEELRHQYLIAFEPSGEPGWHPLQLRARDRKLTVRARSGYMAGRSNPGTHQ